MPVATLRCAPPPPPVAPAAVASCEGEIEAYADGACLANGRKDARAGIGVYCASPAIELSERIAGLQTNQRAELHAAIRALEVLPEHRAVKLHLDSKYLINGITDWLPKWRRSNWRKHVANRDLFERLDCLLQSRRVRLVYVPGHTGVEGNERADVLAKRAAGHVESSPPYRLI